MAMRGNTRRPWKIKYGAMIEQWYNEVDDWPAANVASYSSDGTTGVTGHYTQVYISDANRKIAEMTRICCVSRLCGLKQRRSDVATSDFRVPRTTPST